MSIYIDQQRVFRGSKFKTKREICIHVRVATLNFHLSCAHSAEKKKHLENVCDLWNVLGNLPPASDAFRRFTTAQVLIGHLLLVCCLCKAS